MRTVLVAVLFAVGCGSGMGTDGMTGTTGTDGQNGQNGQNGMTGATGATGPAGPIGPHVTVKDKDGQVLGIVVGGTYSLITVMTYHSTVAGLADGYLLSNLESTVYNPDGDMSAQIASTNSTNNLLYWSRHLAVGVLFKEGTDTNYQRPGGNEVCSRYSCVQGVTIATPPDVERLLVDSGFRYDVAAGLPWTLSVE